MHIFRVILLTLAFGLLTHIQASAQAQNNRLKPVFIHTDHQNIELSFKTPDYSIVEEQRKDMSGQSISMTGIQLPAQSGCPDLPVYSGRYIIPFGAEVEVRYDIIRQKTISGIDILPAPEIPFETDSIVLYRKNTEVYSRNAFYPENIIQMSPTQNFRGFETVILNWTPFRYNPVSKELIVIEEINISLHFIGGSGQLSDDRMRNPMWDQIVASQVENPEAMPPYKGSELSRANGYEYLIIVPNDSAFSSWADSLRIFRNQQGIKTGIVRIEEIGANTPAAISAYIKDALENWDIPPAAILFMADYGVSADDRIMSPVWDDYCISDNLFADIDNDGLPDVVTARMPAQNATQLEYMVRKTLDFERNPPLDESYYNKPITALGWQTERWFQLCSEAISGYFRKEGKNPVRINDVYEGNPNVDPWSSSSNTNMIINTFGPNGLGYIPATPQELGGWTGGNATAVNDALNEGSFMLIHRDHGSVNGWGEPSYDSDDINSGLNNNELLPFIFSINCLTGKFNVGGSCFAEVFYRHPKRALGIIAATEVSYSFVNDAYMWGVMDYMYPDFLPDFGEDNGKQLFPAFANVSGKYFLEASSWPWNENNKEVTYMLFHHHGDAYLQLFSEVPQNISATMPERITDTASRIVFTAPENCKIGLSVDGEFLNSCYATGQEQSLGFPAQTAGKRLKVVLTSANKIRTEYEIQVVPNNGPFLVCHEFVWQNTNQQLDAGKDAYWGFTLENIGFADASAINLNMSCSGEQIGIENATLYIDQLNKDSVRVFTNNFLFSAACNIADLEDFWVDIQIETAQGNWEQQQRIYVHAPDPSLVFGDIEELEGNNNGWFEPGESAQLNISINNLGSAILDNTDVAFAFEGGSSDIEITSINGGSPSIDPGSSDSISLVLRAKDFVKEGTVYSLIAHITADCGFDLSDTIPIQIGRKAALVLDLDRNNNSAPAIVESLTNLGYSAEYTKEWPEGFDEYKSVFLCLGMFGTNSVINYNQGDQLAEYLEKDGRLYLEGGDVWVFNPKTTVHPMFHIEGLDDGSDNLNNVDATVGGFTGGLSFKYTGDNRMVDHIKGTESAVNLFYNPMPSFFVAVAYEQENYKTIGTSFEFGGLEDGDFPSTKDELMRRYMEFFGFLQRPEQAETPVGTATVCASTSEEYTTMSVPGAQSYLWQLTPQTAGIMIQNDTSLNIEWSASFAGSASISVMAENENGFGAPSESLTVEVNPLPAIPPMPVGNDSLLQNEAGMSSAYFVPNPYDDIVWQLIPVNAGNFSMDGDSLRIQWSGLFSGIAALSAANMNDCGTSAYGDALDIHILNTEGINTLDYSQIVVYPNPVSDHLIVEHEFHASGLITIYNSSGQIVLKKDISSGTKQDIAVSFLPEGVYLLVYQSETTSVSSRFILSRP